MFRKSSESSHDPSFESTEGTPSNSPINGGGSSYQSERVAGERIRGLLSVHQYRRSLCVKETFAEVILWEKLRAKRFRGLKFRRQHGIGPYIVDFYCDQLKLVIEVDGSIHNLPSIKEADIKRQQDIEDSGYRLIRFQNQEVLEHTTEVLERIGAYSPPFMEGPGEAS